VQGRLQRAEREQDHLAAGGVAVDADDPERDGPSGCLEPDGVADPGVRLVGERLADDGHAGVGACLGVAVPAPGDQVRGVQGSLGEPEELRRVPYRPGVVDQQRLCFAYARDRADRLLRSGVERLAGRLAANSR
jgi:hypothetical protein